MKHYIFKCEPCNRFFEVDLDTSAKVVAKCIFCKEEAVEKEWSTTDKDLIFKPYWSEELEPTPNKQVLVESLSHKKQLMKKYGLEDAGRSEGRKYKATETVVFK